MYDDFSFNLLDTYTVISTRNHTRPPRLPPSTHFIVHVVVTSFPHLQVLNVVVTDIILPGQGIIRNIRLMR